MNRPSTSPLRCNQAPDTYEPFLRALQERSAAPLAMPELELVLARCTASCRTEAVARRRSPTERAAPVHRRLCGSAKA